MVKDPICGMEIDERDAPFYTHLSREETLYFCSLNCKKAFDIGPDAEEAETLNWWQRFIKRLGSAAKERYGAKPPSCH